MALESFYGGRPGITPVIKKSFKYIDTQDPAYLAASNPKSWEVMDSCFSDGDKYTDVWYNELCIIDAPNKNSTNNGHLYRRTLKGAGDSGESLCAQYLGRIVGASGANPALIISDLETIKNLNLSLGSGARVTYPTDSSGINATTTNSLPSSGTLPLLSGNTDNIVLVPGKDDEGEYHDDIKYTWVNVMSDTEEDFAAKIYLGFQIPYLVNEFEVSQLDWTQTPKINLENISDGHPFYNMWQLEVPQGVRGNAASGVKTAYPKDFYNTATSANQNPNDKNNPHKYLFDVSKVLVFRNSQVSAEQVAYFNIPENLDDLSVEATPEILRNPDGANQDQPILVYDYYIYNKYKDDNDTWQWKQEYLTFFLGYYRQIVNVNLTEEGKLTASYNSAKVGDASTTTLGTLNWIKGVNVTTTGLLTFTGNNNDTNINREFQLPYPTGLKFDSYNGNVTLDLAGTSSITLADSENVSVPAVIDFVEDLTMDPNTKVVSITKSRYEAVTALNDSKGLNYITAACVDKYNHLLIFFASTQYRPLWDDIKEWDSGESSYKPKADYDPISLNDGGYRITWNGLNFRNGISQGTKIENIEGVLTEAADSDNPIFVSDFWLDLGVVKGVDKGVRVNASVKYERYSKMTLTSLMQCSAIDFANYFLNVQYWDNDNLVINPYYEGYIGHYSEEGKIIYLEDGYGDPLWGGVLLAPDIQGGSAFFYDKDGSKWVYLGAWNEDSQSAVKIDGDNDAPNLASYGMKFFTYGSEGATPTRPNDLPSAFYVE